MRLLLDTLAAFALAAAPAALLGCAEYDGPPQVTLANQVEGRLTDPKAPIVLLFSEPPDPSTLRIKIAALQTDAEGNLLDEDDPFLPTEFVPTFVHEPGLVDEGGTSEFVDPTTLRITLNTPLPVGPSQVIIVEPHLADLGGNDTDVRTRIPFGYKLECKEGMSGSQVFTPGAYFFLAQVMKPIQTQLQLLAVIDYDPETSLFVGQFTNADRNRDPDRCPMPCSASEACQLIPTPKCVVPSVVAGSTDEYSDWVPNFETDTGYTFTAAVCVEDQEDGTATFVNAPVDLTIKSPPVTVKSILLTAAFTREPDGVLRGNGSVGAAEVFLGMSPSGAASGTLTARSIPEGEVPANLPKPPAGGASAPP